MKLGTYVEVINYVDDTKAAGEYYAKLGLNALGDDVYGDGRYHLRLVQGNGENPTLRYYGCDKNDKISSPEGVQIELTTDTPPLKLPHDDIAFAPETTRLGKFGELSVMVDDLEVEAKFWEDCGYTTLGKYTEPMAWGIWSDDMFLIGIHQYEGSEEPFAITYFRPEMKDINENLADEGFELGAFTEEPSDDSLTHATLMSPYGIKFYLFTGDISKAKP